MSMLLAYLICLISLLIARGSPWLQGIEYDLCSWLGFMFLFYGIERGSAWQKVSRLEFVFSDFGNRMIV